MINHWTQWNHSWQWWVLIGLHVTRVVRSCSDMLVFNTNRDEYDPNFRKTWSSLFHVMAWRQIGTKPLHESNKLESINSTFTAWTNGDILSIGTIPNEVRWKVNPNISFFLKKSNWKCHLQNFVFEIGYHCAIRWSNAYERPAWISNHMLCKVGVKPIIHSQTSTVATLPFRNG